MNLNKYIHNRMELKGAIIGRLRGDLCIFKIGGGKSNAWFTMTHGVEQKEYLELKTNILNMHPLVNAKISERNTHLKKTDSDYLEYQSVSNRNKYATYLYNLVYPNKKKIVNKKILDQITDFGLFLWYLDDGYLNIRRYPDGNIKEYRIFLYTMNFTFEEVVVIKNWFIEKYNISPNINKKQNGYILYFNASKTRDFMKIIDPFYNLVPCLNRKFLKEYI